MTFEGTTNFTEGSVEQVAIETARRRNDERGQGTRKHFLDAYAEHLEALKRDRSAE